MTITLTVFVLALCYAAVAPSIENYKKKKRKQKLISENKRTLHFGLNE